MVRKIIHIDEEKCNGCGLCAEACHEGAIDIVDGKAKLMRENFCDGFGDCLPNCPTGAITFEEREAPAYDEAAVKKAQEAKKMEDMKHVHHEGGCPGSRMMQFAHKEEDNSPVSTTIPVSRLAQWPCQIKLVPTQAPFFDGAKLLIAADCTAYAYANMHEEFFKRTVGFIALSIGALCLASCGGNNDEVDIHANQIGTGEEKIAVVKYMSHTSLNMIEDAIVQEVVDKLDETKYTLTKYDGAADSSIISQTMATLKQANTDVVICIATPVAIAAKTAFVGTNTKVVFAAVSDPVAADIVSNLSSPEGISL